LVLAVGSYRGELAASTLQPDQALVNGTPPTTGFPPSGVDPLRNAAKQRAFGLDAAKLEDMTGDHDHGIHDLAIHPDAEALREHDHPRKHLSRWRAILTAKAWMGSQLACFFVQHEGRGKRIVLVFNDANAFHPGFGGEDMRTAPIAALYDLDVFVPEKHLPIVDRAERVPAFVRRR
jgi:hypothetical protein